MRRHIPLAGALALAVFAGAAGTAGAQELEREFMAKPRDPDGLSNAKIRHPPNGSRCAGFLRQVSDVGFEGLRTTAWNFSAIGGGGEGARFDPQPVLSTQVNLTAGCLNAHLSAIVGSNQTYGGAAPLTLFQVTATSPTGGIQHLYGHYETPYGVYAPAVATEAEKDVDEHASNFFARVGDAPGDLKPGVYRIDVWWAGAGGPGGAIGAAFVLKLYQQ